MSYCRLCLTDILALGNFSITKIHDKIKTVFSFEITSHPDLPEVICPSCVEIVSQFYDYFCLVNQNQLKLYCQIEENLVKKECSELEDDESKEYHTAAEKVSHIEPNEANFDKHTEPMEDDDDAFEEIELENDDEWLPEDAIETDSNELDVDNCDKVADECVAHQPWKLEYDCLHRQLDLVCDVCQKRVTTYHRLETHMQKAHAKKCYIACCKGMFDSEQIISNHFVMHDPVVKIEGILLEENGEMSQQINDTVPIKNKFEHTPSEHYVWKLESNLICRYLNLTCGICHGKELTYAKLAAHMKEYHSKECYITCCSQKFSSDQMLTNHFDSHCPSVQSLKTKFSKHEYRRMRAYDTVFIDFAKDLEGYEPLPNMELALQDHIIERKKLSDLVDFLVDKYFPMDCDICEKKCESSDERRKHMRQSHPKEKFYFICCGYRFGDRFRKMRHLNNHWKPIINETPTVVYPKNHRERMTQIIEDFRDELEEAGFKPPKPGAQTLSTDELNYRHQMQDFLVAKHLSINCDLCDAKMNSCAERRDHLRNAHSQAGFYIECCGIKMYKRDSIMVHLKLHRNNHLLPGSFRTQSGDDSTIEAFYKMDCMFCDYKGDSFIRLRSHFVNHHQEEGFFITCCNIKLRERHHILAHIESHRNPTETCAHCEQKFPDAKALQIHTRSMHTSNTDVVFKCDQCDKLYKTEKMLLHHSRQHKKDKCDICGVTMFKNSILRHKKTVHKLGQEITCPDCLKVYYHRSAYNNHYKTCPLRRKNNRK